MKFDSANASRLGENMKLLTIIQDLKSMIELFVNIVLAIATFVTLLLNIKYRHDDNNKVILDTYIKYMDEFMF